MASIQIKVPDWLDRICAWPVMVYRKHKYGYSFRRIYLGEGEWTILEPLDYYRLRDFKWRLLGNGWNFYAVRDAKTKPYRTKVVSLHREIMNHPDGCLVDHRNGDSLDNRKANLRLATHSQNSCNSRRDKSKTSSRFRGVIFEKRSGLWLARIKHHGKLIGLGRFKNQIDAAKAYDVAARKYHGEFARLNFCEEVASAKGPRYNDVRVSLMRTVGYCILFAIIAFAGCIASEKTAVSRSNEMATAKITLKEAKSQKVWGIFRQVSAVPRCSKNEGRILDWLKDFAKDRNLACRSDAVGNTVIELPATKGYENAPAVVLQSHVDMVCEKTPESKHDFSKDPIELIERDGWITANGTTLGADDGLGVSLALALADEKLPHPRLELLFTVDEETGLTGANGLQQGFITGKYLVNLDGEDESFIVGCAGGEITEIILALDWEAPPAGLDCYALKVRGLYGGHSGVDIDKGRANAIKLLVKTLRALDGKFDLKLCSIDAGKAPNAIPRDAQAVILLAPAKFDEVRRAIADMETSFKKEFSETDPNLKVTLEKSTETKEKKIMNHKSEIINLLLNLPTGVYRMSDKFKGTVETSNNLARVETSRSENLLRITTMQRSFELSAMDELTGKIVSIAKQAGAKTKIYGRYPSWKPFGLAQGGPDTRSTLLKRAKEIYRKLNKKEPEVKVVHAGLECAVIGEKFPGIEMISVGPTIENPHSPQERLNIASVDNAWEFLIELIPSLK